MVNAHAALGIFMPLYLMPVFLIGTHETDCVEPILVVLQVLLETCWPESLR